MNVEVANRCPRCGDAVFVAPMHAGGLQPDPKSPDMIRAHDLALGYQCPSCAWYVIQPDSNTMSAADFLAAALGPASLVKDLRGCWHGEQCAGSGPDCAPE